MYLSTHSFIHPSSIYLLTDLFIYYPILLSMHKHTLLDVSMNPSTHLSMNPFTHMSMYSSIYLQYPIHPLTICASTQVLSVYLNLSPPTHLFIHLSVHESTWPYTHQLYHVSVHLPTHTQSIHLSGSYPVTKLETHPLISSSHYLLPSHFLHFFHTSVFKIICA